MKIFKKIVLSTMLVLFMMLISSVVIPQLSTNTVQAASIKLNKKQLVLNKNSNYKLKLTGTKKKIKWSSSNKKVATVSSKGKIKTKKYGNATITAKVGKKKYKCKLSVMSNSSIKSKLRSAYNWQCTDIWNNGFCDIYHYIESGTNSLGYKMNINTTVKNVKKALKKKNNWNNFVTSIEVKKFNKYKSTWNKLYKEMLFLEKCLNKGIPKANSNYYFPYEKYSSYLWNLLSCI